MLSTYYGQNSTVGIRVLKTQNTGSKFSTANYQLTIIYVDLQAMQQVCPQSCGKSAALLRQLATPRAKPKPARLVRPTRLHL